jgi:hypothetical protein
VKSKNLIVYSLFLACFALTETVWAQQTNANTASFQLSKGDCSPNGRTLHVTLSKLPQTGGNIYLIPGSLANNTANPNYVCADTPPSDAKSITIHSQVLSLHANALVKDACTVEGSISLHNYLCIYDGSRNLIGQIHYSYDTTEAKISVTTTPGDKNVVLALGGKKGDQTVYQICYGTEDKTAIETDRDCQPPFILYRDTTSGASITIKELENNKMYVFKARLLNDDKNRTPVSQWSAASEATPTESFSFTDVYNGDAPPIQLDCNQGATSLSALPLWGFLGLILLGLRRKKIFSVSSRSLFGILFLAALPVSAHLGQLNLTIKGTPYLPNIDNSKTVGNKAVNQFFRCQFGNGGNPLLPLMGADLDVHLVDAFGSLQIGGGIAYTHASGFASKEFTLASTCPQATTSPVGAHLFQIKFPQITYILDQMIEQIPIAPYIRTGLLASGYVFTFENGIDKPGENLPENDIKPIGITFGWEAAAGFLFMLDVFDRRSAGQSRGLGVLNHTYLKAEIAYAPLDNLGRGGPDLSSAWPTKNIPLMLNFGLVLEFP